MIPDESTHRSGTSPYRGTATTLTVVSIYAVVAAGVLWWFEGAPTVVRIPLGLPLLIFAPGYAAMTALFPATGKSASGTDGTLPEGRSRAGCSPLERGVLAVVTSIAIVGMVALATTVVAGVALGPILAGVAGVTVVASSAGIVRAPPADALEGQSRRDPDSDTASWSDVLSSTVTLLAIGLTVVLLVASAAVAFVGSPSGPQMTEFYLVNDPGTGNAAGGASDVAGDGQPAVYDLRIEHQGNEPRRYTVVVVLEPDDGTGEATELDRFSTVVRPGETASETYRADPSELAAGSTLLFLLYEGNAPSDPDRSSAHRTLKLSVDVTTEQPDSRSVPS